MTSIRVKVIGVARKEDKILAGLYEHPSTGFKFYCPIGGGMELGERSEETLHREFNEEIKAKLSFQKLLGVLENHFELEGRVGHEIVYVYQVEFKDKSLYAKSSIAAIEDNGYEFEAHWIPVQSSKRETVLYPNGLEDLLTSTLV